MSRADDSFWRKASHGGEDVVHGLLFVSSVFANGAGKDGISREEERSTPVDSEPADTVRSVAGKVENSPFQPGYLPRLGIGACIGWVMDRDLGIGIRASGVISVKVGDENGRRSVPSGCCYKLIRRESRINNDESSVGRKCPDVECPFSKG